MAELPSDLVPYVYSFLVGLNLQKAAKALKKEAKVVRWKWSLCSTHLDMIDSVCSSGNNLHGNSHLANRMMSDRWHQMLGTP